MRYTGIQPQYFPRLHYFARILNSDIFVVRDDAQFLRKHKYPGNRIDKSYQAHSPIKQANGIQLLSIPTKHSGFTPLMETLISYDTNWTADHLKAIQLAYSKAPNYIKYIEDINNIFSATYKNLAEFNLTTIYWGILVLLTAKKIQKKELELNNVINVLKGQKLFRLKNIKRASLNIVLKQNTTMSANEKIVALCREFGITEDYCGGTGVAAYVDKEYFKKNGIKITVQDWHCQEYPQLFGKIGFIPNLSIIDLIMNVPVKTAVRILRG